MRKVKIGLLGFGNVGRGTYEALNMNRSHIEKKTGISFEISKILVKDVNKDRRINLPASILTDKISDVLEDTNIDIAVEVLGGLEPATEYMLEALKQGKHVVTANKAAVAHNYGDLHRSAKERNLLLKLEACVAGGIPILHPLTTVLDGNQFTEISGILNGTTNYILTKMTEEGLDYNTVLKTAQKKGFAEADPTADVEGIDAANKLSILMALAFDKYVHPDKIPTEGISKINMKDIENARKENKKIKLFATAKIENDKLTYFVKPVALPCQHPLTGVSNEFNAVFLNGNAVDELMFYGKGAGPLPTGSAVLGDIIQVGRHIIFKEER